MFSVYFSGQRPMRPSIGCQLRWEQVNLCQMLESGEFICKDTQPPRKCAVLAWVGKGQHIGVKQTISARDLLCLLLVRPVKSSHSLRWSKVCVVTTALCWRTRQIPPVHWFKSTHLPEKKGPHSYAFISNKWIMKTHSVPGTEGTLLTTMHVCYLEFGADWGWHWPKSDMTWTNRNSGTTGASSTNRGSSGSFSRQRDPGFQFGRHPGISWTQSKGNTLNVERMARAEAPEWKKTTKTMTCRRNQVEAGMVESRGKSLGWGWRSMRDRDGVLLAL